MSRKRHFLRHPIATGNLVYYLMDDPGAVIGPWDRAGIREGPDPMERVLREWIRAASIANGLDRGGGARWFEAHLVSSPARVAVLL
jgi:hypothetical protein